MLTWVIQITIISFILIFLVHHLINFFKATLTVPKIKDLVNTSTQRYENMYNIIQKKSNTFPNDYTLIDLLPKKEETMGNETIENGTTKNEKTMKNELKNFLKKQLHDNGVNISSPDFTANSYSLYN